MLRRETWVISFAEILPLLALGSATNVSMAWQPKSVLTHFFTANRGIAYQGYHVSPGRGLGRAQREEARLLG